MKKSKVLLTLLCAVALVATSVFGTLAYLTSQDAVVNTFTIGSVVITLDEQEGVLLIGVEGTVRQVQLSEVMWLEDTPIAQDLRFSALRLEENDVLEIYGGYCDETKSYVIEFTDGRGEHHLYHIRDGELMTER